MTTEVYDVTAYDQKHTHSKVPVGHGVTAYDDPETGATTLLYIGYGLVMSDIDISLLNPNQMRAHGVTVHDTPRQFDSQSTHSIYAPNDDCCIPLLLDGILSY